MTGLALRAVRGIARLPFLPAPARAGYALGLKRLWKYLPSPVIADLPGIGRMNLDPTGFIDSRLFFFQAWEPEVTRALREMIKPGTVAVDIGANIGYYTLLMSRAVGPTGHVYAVEPGPAIREQLNANLALNNVKNVTVVPYGISDRTERRAFIMGDSNLGASHFGEASSDGIELRQLEDVIAEKDLDRVGFIKIDVEGMEVEVMRNILALRPRLAEKVSMSAEVRMTAPMRALINDYRSHGFRTLLLDNKYKMLRYARGGISDPRPADTLPDGQLDILLLPAASN